MMTQQMKIGSNTIVSLHFRLWNEEGTLLQETFSSKPVRYLHGGAAIDRSLQEKTVGLSVGSRSTFEFTNAGCRYVVEIYVEGLRPAGETEIELGYPVEGSECNADCECFNHLK